MAPVTHKRFDEWPALEIGPSDRVFVLTGAGISAESGISTFRDANGLWEQHPVEQVASPAGWQADPALVWRFYSERRVQAAACEPNVAHRALAELEMRIGDRLFVCTQNVDDLHERGGSTRVTHMHGELFRTRCEDPRCANGPHEDRNAYPAVDASELPRCPVCSARVRPHICWFGEMPFDMPAIGRALDSCTVFVTVGSSGAVYPAAGFVAHLRVARARGRHVRLVYVGPETPDNADFFDECRLGKAGEVLPSLFAVG